MPSREALEPDAGVSNDADQFLVFVADPPFLRHEDENSAMLDENLHVLLYEDTALCEVETGELVDEDSIDLNTENQPGATPGEGLRHTATLTETPLFVPEYFCLDYRAAGLTPGHWVARNAGMVNIDTDPTVDLEMRHARRHARRPKPNAPRPKHASGEKFWHSTSSAMPRWVCAASL